MRQKTKSNLGDEIINNINLQARVYLEKSLVELICTAAQKREYNKRGKFPNSQKQKLFFSRLSRYCEYEHDPESRKYKITRVFESPITDAELKLHKGIYQYLAPLILAQVISDEKNRMSLITSYDLARDTYMVNRNYGYMKSRQNSVVTDIKIHKSTVLEFFTNTDSRIDDYVEQCIKYLATLNCIFFDQIHIIAVDEELSVKNEGKKIKVNQAVNRHKATQKELENYASIVDKASVIAGVVNASDRWYGKTGVLYKAALDSLLKAEGIKYVIKGFELYRINMDRCKYILQTFKDKTLEDCKQEIGTVFKYIVDSNAEKRSADKPRADKDFIENFKNLSEITLLYDAEDIRPYMLSAKSYQDLMQERAQNIQIDYSESTITT